MEIEYIFKFATYAGVITALIVAFFHVRKFYQWFRPIKIEPSFRLFYANADPDEIIARITNRSTESQYILQCSARGTYSFRHILMEHIRNPLLKPSLYPNIWYGSVIYRFMDDESIKLELHQPIELTCKLHEHPLNAMHTPYFFIEVELSSGKHIRSNKIETPGRWKYIGQKTNEYA